MSEPLRSVVTFRSTSFNTTQSKEYFINPGCFGDDLVRWIAEELSRRGARTEHPGQEDFGWYVKFDFGGEPHVFVTAYRPDDCWIAWLEKASGLWGTLIGSGNRNLSPRAARELHNILSTSPQISDLKWHYKKDFDGGSETGNPTPTSYITPVR